MKQVRFLHDYIHSRAGDVIEEGDGVADILVRRGIVEEVLPEEPEKEKEVAPTQPAARPVTTRRVPGPREDKGPGRGR